MKTSYLLLISFFSYMINVENVLGKKTADVCQPGIAEAELKINNVRELLSSSGDMWWNRTTAQYIVPQASNVAAIFAGSIWLGGSTNAGSLKVAGSTYRSLTDNFDYYPGPLDENGITNMDQCKNWDKIFSVLKSDIDVHRAKFKEGTLNCNNVHPSIKYWPGKGNPFFGEKYYFELPDQSLANFYDENADGFYNPCEGDFPIAFDPFTCVGLLIPDQFTYNVFNDNGGPHRLTAGGDAIQIEVHVTNFAFKGNDEINNATFKNFKLVNKANEDLIDFYAGIWADPDLGCYQDDYVGVDSMHSLAYIYNEDVIDGIGGAQCPGSFTFGKKPPILGISILNGLRGPKVFARDNNGKILYNTNGFPILENPQPGTGDVDTLVNLYMSSFMIHENCSVGSPDPNDCDPDGLDMQYLNALQGKSKFGNQYLNPVTGKPTKFLFSDNPTNPNGWSMCTSNMQFGDRRMLLSTGPAILQPGAVNNIKIALPFQRFTLLPCPDIRPLIQVNHVLKNKLETCLDDLLSVPAPDLEGQVNDKKIAIEIVDNDGVENFSNADSGFPGFEGYDATYKFEGYQVFQVLNENVTHAQLKLQKFARVAYQTDVKNNVKDVYSWSSKINPIPAYQGDILWKPTLEVKGSNLGLEHNFIIEKDLFNGLPLVPGKTYYYIARSYAYNNWKSLDVKTGFGQRRPFLTGYVNSKVYSFTVPFKLNESEDYSAFKYKYISGGYQLFDLPEHHEIQIFNTSGSIICSLSGTTSTHDVVGLKTKETQIHIVKILDKNTKTWKMGKVLVY